jgi:predicted permease
MKSIRRFFARLMKLFARRDDDIVREMQAHLDMATEEYVRRGFSREGAARRARMDAGSLDAAAEAWRDQSSVPPIESLLRDLRFAVRGLRRSPRFTAGIILSLALGIGLNTAIFAVTDTVLRRAVHYPDADRLISVGSITTRGPETIRAWTAFGNELKSFSDAVSFSDQAVWYAFNATISSDNSAEFAGGGFATSNLLSVLQTKPLLGRGFAPHEGGLPVVISEALWQRRFQRDSAVIGKTLVVNATPRRIIGVLPRGIGLPVGASFWTPYSDQGGEVLGRLRDGATPESARRELQTLSFAAKNSAKWNQRYQVITIPLAERLFGSSRSALLLLTGAAVLLLLITAANVTNLALARTVERRREFAMRIAVGASGRSIGALLLFENLLLALIGAFGGVVLSSLATNYLVSLAPPSVAIAGDIRIRGAQIAFAAVLALVTCMCISAAPILSVVRGTVTNFGLTGTGSGRAIALSRLRRALVVAQLAVTVLLVVGAGALIRTVERLTRPEHLGFSPQGIVVLDLTAVGQRYSGAQRQSRTAALVQEIQTRVRGIPGVTQVSTGPAPLVGGGSEGLTQGFDAIIGWTPPNDRNSTHTIWEKFVDPDYRELYGIRLIGGRWFGRADVAGSAPVVILNRTAAHLFFGQSNAVGKTISRNLFNKDLFDRELADSLGNAPVVVGVINDVLQRDLGMTANPEIYFPAAQRRPPPGVRLSIKTGGSPTAVMNAVRAQLREVDPLLAATRLEPMTDVVDASAARHNFIKRLLTLFAMLGLVLSMVGLYAIVSYLVSQRTTELGVRIALGAQPRHIGSLVIGEAARLVLIGIAVGIPLALGGTRLLSGILYDIHVTDIAAFSTAPVLLAIVAIGAAWLPARRATKVSPTVAMRAD